MFIRDLVRRLATVVPDKTAYVDPARAVTWGEVHERSDRLAAALGQLGLSKGARSAIISYETVDVMEHWIACAKAGIARTGINWRYARREMAAHPRRRRPGGRGRQRRLHRAVRSRHDRSADRRRAARDRIRG
jgi:acyl-CoA synthetase (AMP-forming)/AMP-acid ligase II